MIVDGKNLADWQGEELIFLICQPRSGSTLLQRMLGEHADILVLPEPWVMLHPLYARRREGIETEYDHSLALMALDDYLRRIDADGDALFDEAVKAWAWCHYRAALADSGKTLFLDKTPRYYFVAEDLQRLFPRARFIFLLRNPLAVLRSLLNTWVKDDWAAFSNFRHDLLTAPAKLLAAAQSDSQYQCVLHYETLVSDPEGTLKRLCAELSLDFQLDMLRYRGSEKLTGGFGDPVTVNAHDRPVGDYADQWRDLAADPQRRHLAHAYLDQLGDALLHELGYPPDKLRTALGSRRVDTRKVIPWERVIDPRFTGVEKRKSKASLIWRILRGRPLPQQDGI